MRRANVAGRGPGSSTCSTGWGSAAVYDAVVAIRGGYEPYGPAIAPPASASADAAVIEAAYRTLVNYFPAQATVLDPLYTAALNDLPDDQATADGQAVGAAAANLVIALRANDGLRTPIGVTSAFPTLPPGPGVWRLVPPAFAAPQTPWFGEMTPFLLERADQFLPDAPPSLASLEWSDAFNEIKRYGASASSERTPEQTRTALFWTANAIRQYNVVVRDVIAARDLNLLDSARLQAMVNMVGADAQIAVMNAKYHYLFWRPVTAIDPTSVKPAPGDGFGPIPGFNDGNVMTVEEPGWRPVAATPNHPEYPAAHGSFSSATAEVFSQLFGMRDFAFTVHGFDPAGSAGNLDAIRTFSRPNDLRREIVDARLWAGLHYRFSTVAGVALGRQVAKYDLRHGFRSVENRHAPDRDSQLEEARSR